MKQKISYVGDPSNPISQLETAAANLKTVIQTLESATPNDYYLLDIVAHQVDTAINLIKTRKY